MNNDKKTPNTPEPPPNHVDGPAVWDLVLADIAERDKVGEAKYGVRLTPGDGRDSLVDAYQEALDLVVYLRKDIEERRSLAEENAQLRTRLERLQSGAAQLRLDATGWEDASTKPEVYRWLIRRLDALIEEGR